MLRLSFSYYCFPFCVPRYSRFEMMCLPRDFFCVYLTRSAQLNSLGMIILKY